MVSWAGELPCAGELRVAERRPQHVHRCVCPATDREANVSHRTCSVEVLTESTDQCFSDEATQVSIDVEPVGMTIGLMQRRRLLQGYCTDDVGGGFAPSPQGTSICECFEGSVIVAVHFEVLMLRDVMTCACP